MELHRSYKSLNDGAKSFSEFLGLISSGSVRDIYLRLFRFACNVVNEARIVDFNIIIGPLREKFRVVLEGSLCATVLNELDFF
jgi:hypothetical protein